MKLVATDGPHQVVTEDATGGDLTVVVTGLGGELPFPMPGIQYVGDTGPSPMMGFPGDQVWEQGDGTWDFADPNPI